MCKETAKEAVLWLRAESDYTGGVILNMVHGNFQISWPGICGMTAGPP